MSTLASSIKAFEVLKLLGFASFTVDNGKSVTKPLDILIVLTRICTGTFIIVVSLIYRDELATGTSKIVDMGNLVTYVSAVLISIISMIMSFLFRHEVWNISIELSTAEELFSEIGFTEDYARKGKKIIIGLFAFVSLTLPLSFVFYKLDGSIVKVGLYLYSGMYLLLGISSVIGSVWSVQFRLDTINEVLLTMVDNPKGLKIIRNTENDVDVIRKLMEIYSKLMEIVDAISLCYSFQMMLGLGLIFFFTIFTLFMAAKNLSDFEHFDRFSISSLMLATYLMSFVIAEIFSCTKMENKAHEILKSSKKLLKQKDDKLKIAMLTSFTFMVKRKIPKFSCGLFDFDWKLVYAVSNICEIFIM